jgi:glycosyltransferase involved in cell wall biosynthesis
MTATRSCIVVIPGSIDTRSGGYEYDRRIVAALRSIGWTVDVRELNGNFPWPTAAALADAARTLDDIPDGTLVVIDGLALGAMPEEAAVAARRLRIVALVHMPLAADVGLDADTKARFEESERRALASAAGVVVTGASTVAVMQSYGVPAERIAVVEPGTEREPIARGSGGPFVHLVCAAPVTAGKGHDVLIDALSRIPNRDWRLTCAGSLDRDRAHVDRLRTLIRARDLADRVSLVGELDGQGIGSLYDDADVSVFPTRHETFGMAVAEALARGLPVVASSTGAIPQLVASADVPAGIVVPPGDVDALAAALSRIIGDQTLRDRLASGARRVRERLTTWRHAGVAMSHALERFARPSLSQWLELREPYDHAARSESLTRAVLDRLPRTRPIRIVDLGTGTGSNVRYLAPRLDAPQEWLLVDGDAGVLAALPSRMRGVEQLRPNGGSTPVDDTDTTGGDGVRFETREQELGVLDPDVVAGRDLVTASALLDLVSAGWLERLAQRCRAAGAVALFALTYNGRSRCSPTEAADDHVRELLNRHQRRNDKGFGCAAGPDAVECAERAFRAVGYQVRREPSDWHLPEAARELQKELVRGWADAAIELAPDDAPAINDWLARRIAHIDAGRSRIVVCHEDLAAWL